MKMPKQGLARLKAVAWQTFHSYREIVGYKTGYSGFGFYGPQPVVKDHEAAVEKRRFADRSQAEYRCSCSCGKKRTFIGW